MELLKFWRRRTTVTAGASAVILLAIYYTLSSQEISIVLNRPHLSEPHRVHAGISSLSVGGSLDNTPLRSPSGRYQFSLTPSGQLVLEDLESGRHLFTSDTSLGWPVEWHTELTGRGELALTWSHPTEKPFKGTPWISSLLPGCYPIENTLTSEKRFPVLELLDTGKLQIRVDDTPLCVLHRAIDDHGRLAIIYPGFLRTFEQTCAKHNEKLVQRWNGSGGVDVHVFGYLEDSGGDDKTADVETLSNKLRQCFGDNLKTVELAHIDDIQETWPDRSSGDVGDFCDQAALDRHVSQFKSIYLAGQQVRRYMVENAVQYDYMLRLRLDFSLWGAIPPLDPSAIPTDGLIVQRPAFDWVWYSLLHDDTLRAGVTDFAAFGRPNAMFTYMDLYRELVWLRRLEKGGAKFKATNTHDHAKAGILDPETCTPENILAYWLELNGINVATDWRWEMGLLRTNGHVKFTCPNPERNWNCPGFIP